jgi:type IV secretory pathway VirD2 relaxase
VVAVIKTGHSILRLLNYNENKVKEGVAEFLGAKNYPINSGQLTFQQKLNRLKNQAAINQNVTRNSMHISLNFDPSEKLDGSRLQEIAEVYMEKIGLADLPYLVYQHFDAGHPHIHIVSVKVRANGRRVETQNMGKNQSEKARLEIEKKYGLVPAQSLEKQKALRLPPINAERVQYGHSQTARAIGRIRCRQEKTIRPCARSWI